MRVRPSSKRYRVTQKEFLPSKTHSTENGPKTLDQAIRNLFTQNNTQGHFTSRRSCKKLTFKQRFKILSFFGDFKRFLDISENNMRLFDSRFPEIFEIMQDLLRIFIICRGRFLGLFIFEDSWDVLLDL